MGSIDDVIRKFWRDIREQLSLDQKKTAAHRAATQLRSSTTPRQKPTGNLHVNATTTTSIQRERRIHVGVDYGTSWSKLVFRDYEREGELRSYVVRHSSPMANNDFRCPSTIALRDNRLYFGWEAEEQVRQHQATAYRSVKVRIAFIDDFKGEPIPPPNGFKLEDLAVLYLVHLLECARGPATEYCKRLRSLPRISMTLGVPVTDLDNPTLRTKFVLLARLAHFIYTESLLTTTKDLTLDEAAVALELARAHVKAQPTASPEAWIRAEFQAALLWPIQSPEVPAGLYGAIDVGGGTTNASLFQIQMVFDDEHRRWTKEGGGIAFFGAACVQSGADKLDHALALATGIPELHDVRGKENDLIRSLTNTACLDPVLADYFRGYSTSFNRAYSRYQRQTFWKYSVFLLGGGTEIEVVRRRLSAKPWPNMIDTPTIMSCSAPADLFEIGDRGVPSDALKFLLVAYGLSFFKADVPPALTPEQLPPFKPTPRREVIMDLDQIYPK